MNNAMQLSRRELLMVGATAAVTQAKSAAAAPSLILFSKLFPKLDCNELGKTVRRLGFDGVDLTVRPQGHVLPEHVSHDLPRAFEQIRSHGLSLPMITTGLTSAADPAARLTLSTAARLKIPYFKPGYLLYRNNQDIETTLAQAKRDTESLVALAREYGVVAGYHNHSGPYVGTAVWDIRAMIADSDPRWIGYYFDPCHATAEGGVSGWLVSLRMALLRLKMVAVKDFYWEKRNGRWTMQMCPLGQGMVDWTKFFSILAAARFTGPISLHVEYDPKDEEKAAASDLGFLRRCVLAAYGA